MVFEHIDKLKQEYTDKYVVVDDSRPELRRFKGQTGFVKTVNMSGRALVQFDAWENIGWYDIEIDFLKVVDKPAPKEPEKKAKPAAKKAAPAKKAAAKTPAKSEAASPSTADILAAARSGKAPQPAASVAKSDPSKMSTADVLAAVRGNAKPTAPTKSGDSEKSTVVQAMEAGRSPKNKAAGPTKSAAGKAAVDPKSMSVEDILAAARSDDGGGSVPVTATQGASAEEATVESTPPQPPASESASGPLPTDTAAIIEWCRQRDAGS